MALLQPRESRLAFRILVQIGLVLAVVIAGVTWLSYQRTVGSMREEVLDNLRVNIQTRAAFDSVAFVQAQDNTAALRDEYLRRLRLAAKEDLRAEFDAWFVRYPDGLVRVRPERDDFRHFPSIYIRAPVALTPELRRQVVVAFRLLREWGPVMTQRFYSAYIDLPGLSLIMYSPSVNWGKEADPTTNNMDYPPVQNSSPAKNPQRKNLWTEVYFDDKAHIWMLSTLTPMDQGAWIGTASQDIAVDDLIRRTTNEFTPGTYNLIMDRNGLLVAHPAMMDSIQKSAGNLDIAKLGDPFLQGVFQKAQGVTGAAEVHLSPDGKHYLGIARIQGPDWYFVTVYPKSLVEGKSLESARIILLGGVAGLVLELVLLAWIIRRQVAAPLQLRAQELEHEVAERMRVEASLKTSETFKDTLLQTIPDLVFVKDTQGRFIAVNRAVEERYGKRLAEIYGQTDFDFLNAEQAQYFSDRDRDAMEAGGPTLSESWQTDHTSGELALYETIKTPIVAADGAIMGLLGVGRDITARNKAETALQALNQELEDRVARRTVQMEATNRELHQTLTLLRNTQSELIQGEKLASLGRMVAGLAHELNTPIGNALTIGTTLGDHVRQVSKAVETNALKKSGLTDFLHTSLHGVEVLERALRQANELISNFKQVSADQLSERRREFDLAVTVDEILSTLRPGFRGTPYVLESRVPTGILMDSYPGLLTQVISNLVNNAKLHAFEGRDSGMIEVTAVEKGDAVEISVSDNGNGIPADIRNRIFDPFFTTRMGRGGTGLGLSIVHSLVSQGLRGGIQVDYDLALGTRFVVTIPKREPPALAA
jgi:PAS domain S-box-containing protein